MKYSDRLIKIIRRCANSVDELNAECDWEDGEQIAYAVKKYVIAEVIKEIRKQFKVK